VPFTSSRPNAALLTWTPVDLTLHTSFSLLNGLYGEVVSDGDWTDTSGVWTAYDNAVKRAMSPLHVLKRTGLAVPTCLDYVWASTTGHTSSFSGLTGAPYHHPDNGWLLLQYLTAARTAGLDQDGHIFFDNAAYVAGVYPDNVIPAATIVYYYETYGGTATAIGTAATPQVTATKVLDWLNAAM
jgi:hypothetical protein